MRKVAFSELNSGLLTFQRDPLKMATADSTPLWPVSSAVLTHGCKPLFRMSNHQTDQPPFKPADQSDHILTDNGADHVDHLIFLSISHSLRASPPPPTPTPHLPPSPSLLFSTCVVVWTFVYLVTMCFLCVYLMCSVCVCVCVCVCMRVCVHACVHACVCVYVRDRERERMCIA